MLGDVHADCFPDDDILPRLGLKHKASAERRWLEVNHVGVKKRELERSRV